jgi:hypothetical protein
MARFRVVECINALTVMYVVVCRRIALLPRYIALEIDSFIHLLMDEVSARFHFS